METQEWKEAGGEFGTTIRWTQEPSNEWEKENTEYIGDEVAGVLTDIREGVGMNDATVYEIETAEGPKYSIFGSTVLNNKMRKVMIGEELKVKFLGEAKSKTGGKTYKNFQVLHRSPVEGEEKTDTAGM